MAQEAEHVLGKDEVTGSNPVISSIEETASESHFSVFLGAVFTCFYKRLFQKTTTKTTT